LLPRRRVQDHPGKDPAFDRGTWMRIDPRIDYYETLGVQPGAGLRELKRAYRSMAKLHHPDRTGDSDSEQFQNISLAYHILSTPELRAYYDYVRSSARSPGTGAAATRRDEPAPRAPHADTRDDASMADTEGSRPHPPPPNVLVGDFIYWFLGLPIGLGFWTSCGMCSAGFFTDAPTPVDSLPLALVLPLSILPALGFLIYWIAQLRDLQRQRRFYRAYVDAAERHG
jgi:hypothetical protein